MSPDSEVSCGDLMGARVVVAVGVLGSVWGLFWGVWVDWARKGVNIFKFDYTRCRFIYIYISRKPHATISRKYNSVLHKVSDKGSRTGPHAYGIHMAVKRKLS